MRIKYVLKAPADVNESIIEGTPYWPDDAGQIETTNPNHLGPLKLHGYKLVQELSIAPPPRVAGLALIDVDELGKTGLTAALTERGVSYPPESTREELVAIAKGWNAARGARGRPAAVAPAPALQAAPPPQPSVAAPAPAPIPPAPVSTTAEAPDFKALEYDELKGWLAARGVAFAGNAAKKILIGLAEKTHAEILAKAS